MVTSVSVGISEGAGQALLQELFGPELIRSTITPTLAVGLNALAGVQFLFDEHGNFMEEVNAWQIKEAVRTVSRHTRSTRSAALKVITEWFEQQDLRWQDCTELAHMNLMHISYRSSKAPVVKKETWNQWMIHWFRFLQFAEDQGYITGIDFDLSDLKERGTSSQAIRALSGEEFRRFAAAAESQRIRAGCYSCMGAGIRVEELSKLKRMDIPDPTSSKNVGLSYFPSRIIGKGEKERTIYWPLGALKAIARYVHQERAMAVAALIERVSRGDVRLEDTYLLQQDGRNGPLYERDDAPLWLAENGDPLSYHRWGKEFAHVSEKSGVRCSPHCLRHTYAIVTLSMLIKVQLRQELTDVRLGTLDHKKYFLSPLREVQARLGHASIETTEIYLDHIAEHRAILGMAIKELEAAFFDE